MNSEKRQAFLELVLDSLVFSIYPFYFGELPLDISCLPRPLPRPMLKQVRTRYIQTLSVLSNGSGTVLPSWTPNIPATARYAKIRTERLSPNVYSSLYHDNIYNIGFFSPPTPPFVSLPQTIDDEKAANPINPSTMPSSKHSTSSSSSFLFLIQLPPPSS